MTSDIFLHNSSFFNINGIPPPLLMDSDSEPKNIEQTRRELFWLTWWWRLKLHP
jgi:hypothetical protein